MLATKFALPSLTNIRGYKLSLNNFKIPRFI